MSYLIGIDGGASKTRGVIFNGSGKTLACDLSMGSNLSVYGEKAVERIISMIHNLCEKSNILQSASYETRLHSQCPFNILFSCLV